VKLVTFAACVALAIAAVAAAITGREPEARAPELSAATELELCTTLGQLQTQGKPWRVESPKFRATVKGSGGRHVSLEFRFLGETEQRSRLKSGAEHGQLGLKLLSRDTCNVLYVMWRHSPRAELVVSLKHNPAEREHAGCENRGYLRLRPESSSPVPALEPGQVHRLRADVVADTLRVHVDGGLVWQGKLGDNALELRGNAGVRSDNLRFELLELKTEQAGSGGDADCRAAPEDVD
jgi:hypothetical protein